MGLKDRLLKTIGLDSEVAPTEEQEYKQKNEEQMTLAWRWLREQGLDRAIEEYFNTGDDRRIRQYTGDEVASRLIAHLEGLRAQNIAWIPPKRRSRQEAKVTIIASEQDGNGVITSFTVQESFLDLSAVLRFNAEGVPTTSPQLDPEPQRRVLIANVICDGPTDYKISEIRQLSVGG